MDEIPANHEISHSEVDIIHNELEKVAPSTETPCLEKASKATTPAEMSKNLLKYCNKSNIIPTEQQFEDVIFALLESSKIINEKEIVQNELIQAVLLAQTASYIPAYSKVQMLYQQLLTATILPPGSPEYQGDYLDSLFKKYDERTECLMLASYMNAMICPHQAYDHKLQHRTADLFDKYEYRFPSFPTLKPLFHVLLKVQDVSPTGFTDAILSLLGDEAKSATFLKNLQNKAKELLAEPVIKTKVSGLRELCNSCFGSDSDLYACMEIISENRRDEKELVEAVLHNYGNLQTGAFKLDESIIKDKVNKEWSKATLVKSKKKFDHLIPAVRKQIHDAFHQRLSLIQTWLETEEHKEVHDINSLKNLKDELVHTITDLKNNLSEIDPPEHKTILSLMYHNMLNRLTGNPANEFLYADLLRTGIISLDENGTPILDEKQNEITYYEPWRNMLKHIAEPIRILSYVKKQIFNKESPMFDNLHQFAIIGKYLNDDPDYYIVSDQQIQDAEDLGERNIDKFQETLELAYAYNRISENDKENLLADMQQYKESFFTLRDFGYWKQFLDALKEQVKELTAEMGQKLRVDLDDRKAKLKSGETSKLLEEAYTLLEKDKNFAVVEEYINRFDNGQRDIPDELQAVLHDPDSFAVSVKTTVC